MCAILQSASLSTMSIAAGVAVTIIFQQINGTPHAETGPQSDNQSFFVCEPLGRIVSDLRAGEPGFMRLPVLPLLLGEVSLRSNDKEDGHGLKRFQLLIK